MYYQALGTRMRQLGYPITAFNPREIGTKKMRIKKTIYNYIGSKEITVERIVKFLKFPRDRYMYWIKGWRIEDRRIKSLIK